MMTLRKPSRLFLSTPGARINMFTEQLLTEVLMILEIYFFPLIDLFGGDAFARDYTLNINCLEETLIKLKSAA